jgi:hypothetical protein
MYREFIGFNFGGECVGKEKGLEKICGNFRLNVV